MTLLHRQRWEITLEGKHRDEVICERYNLEPRSPIGYRGNTCVFLALASKLDIDRARTELTGFTATPATGH